MAEIIQKQAQVHKEMYYMIKVASSNHWKKDGILDNGC